MRIVTDYNEYHYLCCGIVMPGAHCVVVECTNGSYYKLWQWQERTVLSFIWHKLRRILEVYQLTPAKAAVFSASYS